MSGTERGRRTREDTYYPSFKHDDESPDTVRKIMRQYEGRRRSTITRGANAQTASGEAEGSNPSPVVGTLKGRFHQFYVKGNGTQVGVAAADFVDGIQTDFDLVDAVPAAVIPVVASVVVCLNGLAMRGCGVNADYAMAANTIQFVVAPPAGAELYGMCAID